MELDDSNQRKPLVVGTAIGKSLDLAQLLPRVAGEAMRLAPAQCKNLLIERLGDVDPRRVRYPDQGISLLADLEDLVNRHCPPYVRFGANDEALALVGYWPELCAIERDIAAGDLARVQSRIDLRSLMTPSVYAVVGSGVEVALYTRNPAGSWVCVWRTREFTASGYSDQIWQAKNAIAGWPAWMRAAAQFHGSDSRVNQGGGA
ncbi:hypothetical protein [Thioalkalivibrio thiocyanodenitrificans]|uniref:hypothetical protein n=1 Tax=Thioalkalivibrio thiocyanodenitrificans TaxID=243063 RepID=UPI00037B132B|nr:hypothetical protein [Thioalkalivibrio thiocyanodenitrificans]